MKEYQLLGRDIVFGHDPLRTPATIIDTNLPFGAIEITYVRNNEVFDIVQRGWLKIELLGVWWDFA